MKLRVLIVDDEPHARAKIRRLLEEESGIGPVAEAGSGEQAIADIVEGKPDLLFLDVEMPPPHGLDVLRAVRKKWQPCTIFTTAHAQHAVDAFELQAADYLLKPFTAERFALALGRARERLASQNGARERTELSKAAVLPVDRLLVKNNERYIVVPVADISWVEAAANYVVLHTSAGNHILRRTLAQLEGELDPRRFFRTSRSWIVNLHQVREVRSISPGEHVIVLRDGTNVPLTRGLREFQEKLEAPGPGA